MEGRGLRRNQLCWHLDLGLPASRTGRIHFCCFRPLVWAPLLWQPEQMSPDGVWGSGSFIGLESALEFKEKAGHTHLCRESWVGGRGWVCAKSCPTLGDTEDCTAPDSSVHGILQAGMLEWVAVSSSRGSSQPRNQIRVSCIGRQTLDL